MNPEWNRLPGFGAWETHSVALGESLDLRSLGFRDRQPEKLEPTSQVVKSGRYLLSDVHKVLTWGVPRFPLLTRGVPRFWEGLALGFSCP